MKILLTGSPGVGKSTLLFKVLEKYQGISLGIRAEEIKKDNLRVGFKMVSSKGTVEVFMHKNDFINSKHSVGEYHVNTAIIDNLVSNTFGTEDVKECDLIYIDEIGRAQVKSNLFVEFTNKVFKTKKLVLATIVYDPEPWSLEYKNSQDTLLVEVTKENRDELVNVLSILLDSYYKTEQLNHRQQEFLKNMLVEYVRKEQFIQIKKLFVNSIHYVVSNLIKRANQSEFLIQGLHKPHRLYKKKDKYICDCDLFNGQGKYLDHSGICSHIMAVQLFLVHQ